MTSIYKTEMTLDQAAVLKHLREKTAKVVGVTISGNRLTIRWMQQGQLVSVHTAILSIRTPKEVEEAGHQIKSMDALYEKYPDLEADLYRTEHGEWPK